MNARIAILICGLLVVSAAQAAGFDCAKAAGRVERMICADPELSFLDDALTRYYGEVLADGSFSEEPNDAPLRRAQRRWLARRDACLDSTCVRAAYEGRFEELYKLRTAGVNCDPAAGSVDLSRCERSSYEHDPFADNALSCDEMRRYPDRSFRGDIDLGSGSWSPIAVDYECKESLRSLAFMQTLLSLAEEIRGEDYSSSCSGTLSRAQIRYFYFELLEAGIAPAKLAERNARRREMWSQDIETDLYRYFERWSYEGIGNRMLYEAYLREMDAAAAKLTEHYRASFAVDNANAREYARLATMQILIRAAGSYPRDSIPQTNAMLEVAQAVNASSPSIDDLSKEDRRTALSIALVLQRPLSEIRRLLEKVESLNYGDESPLFFALRSMPHARLLLEHGADPNYQNSFGKTALFYAIGFNDQPMVELLLDKGASINHRYRKPKDADCLGIERFGRTPLMHAAQHADVAMLRLLLRRGANLRDADDTGENATAYALRSHRQENVGYLKAADLLAPGVEEQFRQQRRARECSDEAARRELKDEQFGRFYLECIKQ